MNIGGLSLPKSFAAPTLPKSRNVSNQCRPTFREAFPKLRARAFVWYLKDGPLVTFHRRVHPRRRWPVEIIARYLLPWDEWGQVRPWHGNYDDILEQMNVAYPLP